MAANNEKVTFGATIEAPTLPPKALSSPPSHESELSSNSLTAAEKEAGADSSNPFSAFYKHPEARRSMEDDRLQSGTQLHANHERDIESGLPLSAATTQQPKPSVDGRVKECTMWPSRQAILDQRKMNKKARGCNLFRNLSNKQRLWAKIIIALLVVAAAVGLGVGISRAVGGGVWSGEGQNKQIPH